MNSQADGVTEAFEQRWRDLGEFIREQRRLGQLSLRKLSDLAGVSNPYLSQIERGLRRPSAEILQQIAHALEISAETLYVRAGILDEREPTDPDLVSAINLDPTITPEQKQSLIQIYRSFQTSNGTQPTESEPSEPSSGDDDVSFREPDR